MRLLLITIFPYALSCGALQFPLGLRLDKTAGLPTLTLSYATYRAASFDPNGDVGNLVCDEFVVVLTNHSRFILSRISALQLRQPEISAGHLPHHHSESWEYRMALMVQYASRRPSKDRN